MLPQPQPDAYYDGFNERLFGAVPSRAGRILEVGCARGRLGQELKRQDPSRYVAGVELDSDAGQVAKKRLDEVFVLDVQAGTPPIEPGSLDCILSSTSRSSRTCCAVTSCTSRSGCWTAPTSGSSPS